MICPMCGRSIKDNSKFCGLCGGNISEYYSQTVEALLRDAFIALENHNRGLAEEIINRVLLKDAQNPKANLCKLLLEQHVDSIDDLAILSRDFSTSVFYKNIMFSGDEELKTQLRSISSIVIKHEFETNNNSQYRTAIELMSKSRYDEAKRIFLSLNDWKDSKEKAAKCEALYAEQLKIIEEQKRVKKEKEKKLLKRIRIIAVSSITAALMVSTVILVIVHYFIPLSKYNKALELINVERFDEGYAILEDLGKFKNSDQYILDSKYNRAIKELEKCNYDYAYSILAQIGTYRDANELILQNKYDRAKKHIESEEYEEAFALLTQLGGYSDSSTVLSNARYQYALELKNQGKYEEAIKEFGAIPLFDDSKRQIQDSKYLLAKELYSKQAIVDAYRKFNEISSYEDASSYISEIEAEYPTIRFMDSSIGDCVRFGKYEQDNNISNGKETIEWIILSKEDSRILLLSKYALDVMQFNSSKGFVKWADSSVRAWLKTDFYSSAFSAAEKNAILNVSIDNICENGVVDDGQTTDKVFLLSKNEYYNYIDNTALDDKYTSVRYTNYAKAMEMQRQTYESDDMSWWLRTRSSYEEYGEYNFVWFVEYGCYFSNPSTYYWGIRPAMWVEIKK